MSSFRIYKINKVKQHKPDLNTPALSDFTTNCFLLLFRNTETKPCISLSQLCFITAIKHSSEVIFSHSCDKPTSASLPGAAHYTVLSVHNSCISVCELCAAGSLVCLNSQVDHSSPLARRREEKGRDKRGGGGWWWWSGETTRKE